MLTLDQVVPWGRSFEENRRMFALSDPDLQFKILGCADGPASFNAEASRLGHSVISIDPLYRFDTETIRYRIAVTHDKMGHNPVRRGARSHADALDADILGRLRFGEAPRPVC